MASGLSGAFNIIYILCNVLAIALLFGIFGMATADYTSMLHREAKLRSTLAAKAMEGKGIAIKDTWDFELLQYYSNNASKEPYNVYQIQSLVSYIYMIIGFLMLVVSLEITMFVIFTIWSLISGKGFEQSIKFPFQTLIATIVVVLTAVILNRNYKSSFTNTIQKDIIQFRSGIKDINNYIYDHMPKEMAFYTAMRTGSGTTAVKEYLQKLAAAKNITCLEKSMFAWSLYQSLSRNSDGNIAEIQELFTQANVETRSGNFINFMRYNSSNFVQNLASAQSNPNASLYLTFSSRADSIAYQRGTDDYIRNLNTKLYKLRKINLTKKNLMNYTFMEIIVSIIAIVIVGFVYADRVLEFVRILRASLAMEEKAKETARVNIDARKKAAEAEAPKSSP